ncbi:MAG: DUF4870 domain-containing protein [Chloroflexi bacterium]|nr:hypothetical protein [Anaerolineaceae bacterium]NMB87012.1 DUF4870 domain-containing protein [Chloroflexota bacterium]
MTEQFTTPGIESSNDDRLWALLAYIFTPVIPIIILLMEDKKNRPFLRAHNMQALILGVVLWVINFALSFILVGLCTSLLTIGLVIFYGLKAYRGEVFEIPVVTNLVRSQGWA